MGNRSTQHFGTKFGAESFLSLVSQIGVILVSQIGVVLVSQIGVILVSQNGAILVSEFGVKFAEFWRPGAKN